MLWQADHLLDDLGEALGSGGGLANIPLTLSRWTEESRVLDGDAAHDYITGISYFVSFGSFNSKLYTAACSSWPWPLFLSASLYFSKKGAY